MVCVPRLYYHGDTFVGGVITPNGFQFVSGTELPPSFVALVNNFAYGYDLNRYEYFRLVFPYAKFRSESVDNDVVVTVVSYHDPNEAISLAKGSIGYPCDVLSLLGAQEVRKVDDVFVEYTLYGDIYYCNTVSDYYTPVMEYFSEDYASCYVRCGDFPIPPDINPDDFMDVHAFFRSLPPVFSLSYAHFLSAMCTYFRVKYKLDKK